MKRLDAELRSILFSHLWLGCRDRNQEARAITMFDLVADVPSLEGIDWRAPQHTWWPQVAG